MGARPVWKGGSEMIRKIVFMLEEPSMREMLEGLLPRILPRNVSHQCIPHKGKSDLEKSIPRKLKGWREPGVRFVIVRDQDSEDCRLVKENLVRLCAKSGREDTLVRIVCRELEAWYLGDLNAVEKGLEIRGVAKYQQKSKFRTPDGIQKPSLELKRLTPMYRKVSGSRAIGPHLSLSDNRSRSFHVFIEGVKRMFDDAAR